MSYFDWWRKQDGYLPPAIGFYRTYRRGLRDGEGFRFMQYSLERCVDYLETARDIPTGTTPEFASCLLEFVRGELARLELSRREAD